MATNKIRAAVAAAALAPMIALGSGIATAAPTESLVPVQMADTSQPASPVQVEPAVLTLLPTLGLSLLALPGCIAAILTPGLLAVGAACVVAV
ncbi:hypothetical protein [Nocardia xishanensis]|uniref:hypothetical protein n=1 Tax=Nocardia xishanensis TaxID=238964 RepID=UPI000B2E656C|nr:hypothetical protein [Nocardia xishanensis]